jgi:hypothetical protein
VKCFFCKNSLSDYVEGVVDGEKEEQIKNHLNSCEDCQAYYSDLKHGYDILRQISPLDPGADFYDNVTRHILGSTWYGRTYRKIFLPLKIKGPLLFFIIMTFGIVTSFILIEFSKNSFFSKIKFSLYQPKTSENKVQNKQKNKLRDFANNLDAKIKANLMTSDQDDLENQSEIIEEEMPKNKESALSDAASSKNKGPKSPEKISSTDVVVKNDRDENQLLEKNNFVFKLFLNSNDLLNDTKEVRTIVEKNSAQRASSIELGRVEQEGAYFHMLVPQKNYLNLIKDIKARYPKLTVVKSESDRIVRNYKFRVIVWIENLKK